MHTHIHTAHIYNWKDMYINIYVHMCIYMYVYIYTHIHNAYTTYVINISKWLLNFLPSSPANFLYHNSQSYDWNREIYFSQKKNPSKNMKSHLHSHLLPNSQSYRSNFDDNIPLHSSKTAWHTTNCWRAVGVHMVTHFSFMVKRRPSESRGRSTGSTLNFFKTWQHSIVWKALTLALPCLHCLPSQVHMVGVHISEIWFFSYCYIRCCLYPWRELISTTLKKNFDGALPFDNVLLLASLCLIFRSH